MCTTATCLRSYKSTHPSVIRMYVLFILASTSDQKIILEEIKRLNGTYAYNQCKFYHI